MTEAIVPAGVSDWAREHVRNYLATDGAVGHMFTPPGVGRALPSLLLTTRGRTSGQTYILPLVYGQDGDNYVVVASRGGAPAHPGWYLNLVNNSEAEIQVLAQRLPVRARTAEGEERERLWGLMAAIHPDYNDYQKKTERRIPVVVLEPRDAATAAA